MPEKESMKKETQFYKEHLLASQRYMEQRDILSAVLDDKKQYSLKETDKLIADFMKGKVK